MFINQHITDKLPLPLIHSFLEEFRTMFRMGYKVERRPVIKPKKGLIKLSLSAL